MIADARMPTSRDADMEDIRTVVKAQFGPRAERYVRSADHSQGESLDRLLQVIQPQPHWRALDVATGGGHTALALSRRVREVVATDLTVEMLTVAEAFVRGRLPARPNVTFREADAGALPFQDDEFDLVTCRVAPHHFPDVAQFVRESARVVRPGGLVAVIDNIVPENPLAARHLNAFERLRDPSHNWAYPVEDWKSFFAAAGLAVAHVETFRKIRDLDVWAGMMDVAPLVKVQLQVLLFQAPAPAREALAPNHSGDGVKFWLTEALLVGRKPA